MEKVPIFCCVYGKLSGGMKLFQRRQVSLRVMGYVYLFIATLCLSNRSTQGYQITLASLVDPVLGLCLSHHDQLRNNAVQILYSMIVSEFHVNGHFE